MKVKLIDFGYEKKPYRAHENDAGADVHSTIDIILAMIISYNGFLRMLA